MGDALEDILRLVPVTDVDIPPPHVIEEIKKHRREKERSRYEPVPLELPVTEYDIPRERPRDAPESPDRGVVEIDYAL